MGCVEQQGDIMAEEIMPGDVLSSEGGEYDGMSKQNPVIRYAIYVTDCGIVICNLESHLGTYK